MKTTGHFDALLSFACEKIQRLYRSQVLKGQMAERFAFVLTITSNSYSNDPKHCGYSDVQNVVALSTDTMNNPVSHLYYFSLCSHEPFGEHP